MKRLAILCFSVFLFASCQQKSKQLEVTPTSSHSNGNYRLAPSTLASEVSVSFQGFLVFADSTAYADYIDFLDSNNTGDIQSFTSSIGFTSQVGVLGQAGNEFPADYTNAAYVFDQHGIVQLGDIVYRGLNSSGKFLAMPVEELTSATLSDLKAGAFNPTVMCQLNVGGNYGNSATMGAYVRTHIGFTDNTPVTPVSSNTGARWLHWRDVYPDGSWTQHDVHYHSFLGIIWYWHDSQTDFPKP